MAQSPKSFVGLRCGILLAKDFPDRLLVTNFTLSRDESPRQTWCN
ncbi:MULTISPECIES: hypothetical protein [Laspinema]|nr:hypothetical protein [Laspinema sp. D3a]